MPLSSRNVSPTKQIDNSSYLHIESSKRTDPLIISRKLSFDFKVENNVKTKATYGLADTKDKIDIYHNMDGVLGV